MPNSIIIPTDGSKYAEEAAEVGFEFATKLDATVHAVAVGDVSLAEVSAVGAAPPQSKDDVTEIAIEWAEELAAEAERHGLEAEPVVRTGTPAEEIADYAAELDADMIVIGTAGRTGLRKRILGSVTDEVVRTAPVPVVTVRPDGSVDAA
ncbi:universal stress protein [Natronolimnohabitans innermongolicus]|uniref:Stress response protein n=1 Tax=Natronolimnohabitans innermongolicus JCM 12255 TaxID=1227499 RepID=L9WJ91_9EURY|nr:universal stress protein [Natronolimnohabitans innermongolicus]ELY49540.1 stress response protein [Natronolimnohabitans innermongolicus JCM 12255]